MGGKGTAIGVRNGRFRGRCFEGALGFRVASFIHLEPFEGAQWLSAHPQELSLCVFSSQHF